MEKKGKVLVALSGGVDSTVTAMMLHNTGYDVVGVTMKTWSYSQIGGNKKETGCCNLDAINDARQVAVDMGFPHYIIDLQPAFQQTIIKNFINEYLAGRTPNPCVLCNTLIKWQALLERADGLDCEYIATGHYAKVKQSNSRYFISKARDNMKDQSYVLWGLTQADLKRTIFPLGELTKTEVKAYADKMGYTSLANKAESYEICFVPDNDYRGFLDRNVPDLSKRTAGGNFLLADGTVVGKHRGYPYYTVGQRRGLGIALGKPMFVSTINASTNEITLGEKNEQAVSSIRVANVNWQKAVVKVPVEATVKIRYRSKANSAIIQNDMKGVKVVFDESVSGIAPGQSAVFYDGEDVLGGGIIYL